MCQVAHNKLLRMLYIRKQSGRNYVPHYEGQTIGFSIIIQYKNAIVSCLHQLFFVRPQKTKGLKKKLKLKKKCKLSNKKKGHS